MKFKPGDLCFIVNGSGRVYQETIDRIVEVKKYIGPHPTSGIDTYGIISKGSPMMTRKGLSMDAMCEEINLRLIPKLKDDDKTTEKDKELAL